MKVKATKRQVAEVLVYYTNRLTEEFGHRLCTAAMLYEAQNKIAQLREQGRVYSTNPAWNIDVVVKPANPETNSGLAVSVANESDLLILDFDS